MNIRTLVVLIVLAVSASAQQKSHTLHGTVCDPQGSVIAGVRIMFKSGDKIVWASSDINGDFQATLPTGDYVATVDPADLYKFKAYLNIVDGGLNPDGVVFVVDPSAICCVSKSGVPFPKATTLPKPPFPAAARAVRASGEVIVAVKIDTAGQVTSSSALSGHPLLRRAAETAARGARFEATESPAEREANLTYVFLQDEDEKPALTKFGNAFRIIMIAETVAF